MIFWRNPFFRWLAQIFPAIFMLSFPTYHYQTTYFVVPFLICLFFGILFLHMLVSTAEVWAENKFQVSLREDWRIMIPLVPAYAFYAIGFSAGFVGAFALNASSYWAFMLFPAVLITLIGYGFFNTWRARAIDKGWIKPMDWEEEKMERGRS